LLGSVIKVGCRKIKVVRESSGFRAENVGIVAGPVSLRTLESDAAVVLVTMVRPATAGTAAQVADPVVAIM
jgi:hypothetical protein